MDDPARAVADPRIVFFGDSITQGVGDATAQGWPGRLVKLERARGRRFTAYNLGVRSDTSRHIAKRWYAEAQARLPKEAPRVLVFSYGLNDATRVAGNFRVELRESLLLSETMLQKASALGHVLWVGPTPIDDRSQPLLSSLGIVQTKVNAETERYNTQFAKLAQRLLIPYLDLFTLLVARHRWALSLIDGVHPNAEGYDAIAEEVARWNAWDVVMSPPSTAVVSH